MIKIENTKVWGFEGAIRGMRMPYESFNKSDSARCRNMRCGECPFKEKKIDCINGSVNLEVFVIGNADMTLCKNLIKGGSEHRKFLRMIHVQAEVKAPRYWWAEMDKYKYVEANSSSTMHLITKRELTLDDFTADADSRFDLEHMIIPIINKHIRNYNEGMIDKSIALRSIKQLLPESYNQLRMIDTDYECLLNIYRQRKNHRLSEWSGANGFCSWIESLPYMEEFLNVQ